MKKILIFSIVLFCIVFIGCKEKTDIEFAKAFFENLADGKATVMDDIDWENFSGTGFDIGGKLKSISDNSEKKDLKKSFINSFSDSFKKTSITKEKFTNWKVEDDNKLSTVVSAVFEEDCYLYIVILKKNKVKKISSLMLSSPDLNLSKQFCSTDFYHSYYIEANIMELPQSLLDKHFENKDRKDAELRKISGYSKRIGIEYKRDIITEEDIEIGKSSEDFFDSNGYNIKTIHYDESEKLPPPRIKKGISLLEKENNLPDEPEKRIIEETKKPVKKDYIIKLIDEKTGLYEEKSNRSTFYYSLTDSGNYKFYKINSEYSTQIFKYNNRGNLVNIISISDSDYKSMSAIYYDSLKNIIRISEYLYNGLIADSSYTIKYDTYGKVLENVGYYAPGTFYGFFNIILKCHIEYDNKDNIIERQFVRTNRNDQSLIYLYNTNGNIHEINYMNLYPYSLDYTFGGVITFKYNSKGLLIEKIEHNTPDVFLWVTKYTYYK